MSGYQERYLKELFLDKQEFMKLNFYVNESVLIPRADTEILVEEVINLKRKRMWFNLRLKFL